MLAPSQRYSHGSKPSQTKRPKTDADCNHAKNTTEARSSRRHGAAAAGVASASRSDLALSSVSTTNCSSAAVSVSNTNSSTTTPSAMAAATTGSSSSSATVMTTDGPTGDGSEDREAPTQGFRDPCVSSKQRAYRESLCVLLRWIEAQKQDSARYFYASDQINLDVFSAEDVE
ncbi:hypothetical protein PC114_g4098 [Phytophthora cactorum]|uniref:Uncharacterized protein n=1 Tax=Phytophthora cactorum TaxID=29920 RepID=A0A8T1D9B9_9STRA|nr:hypothetical protein PC114_g4098 [Phytophthora cactorum]KAG2936157.1 hypothetical protein PC115_g4624 [Phytophthora cactorum]